MTKSVKPTLIVIAVMAIPFILVAGWFLYESDTVTLRNVLLVLLLAPLAVVVAVLMSKNNNAFLGMADSVEKGKENVTDETNDQ